MPSNREGVQNKMDTPKKQKVRTSSASRTRKSKPYYGWKNSAQEGEIVEFEDEIVKFPREYPSGHGSKPHHELRYVDLKPIFERKES